MHNHALLIPKDTEGDDWQREFKNQMILKFDWQCKYFFFFHILLTVNKMQTKVTVIGHKNTMPHNLCPIRESNWSTESTCQVSPESLSSKLSCSAKNKVFFSFSYLIILFKP